MKKYKKINIDIELPTFLENDIAEFLLYLNNGGNVLLSDVYRATIRNDINECEGYTIDEENATILREYYVNGGIFSGKFD